MTKNQKGDARIGDRNKAKILAAAEVVFAQNGFKGTSVREVAAKAELPKTNVLYYFKSKQDLYLALLQQIMEIWNSRFDQATVEDDPAETLADYIAEKMHMSRTNPRVSKIFAMEIINGAPNLNEYFDNQHKEWMAGRVEILKGWMAAGKMKVLDPDYLLFNIWACTQHYADFSAQIVSLRGKKMQKADFDLATKNLINITLTGCGLTVPERYQLTSQGA